MGKYTKDNHDCANDGTCGQSITDFRIGNSDISFFDSNKNLIAKVPKLPKYSRDKYGHQLYKEAESKQFNYFSTNIHDVLSNSFTVKYKYINCTIKYDNLSEQEQNQIEKDIKTAYEAFKEKFCLKNSNASYNITVHIFNNRSDYTKYNNLLGLDKDGGPGYITRGVTDYQNILTYKQSAMDFILGHELGHIFQLCFSPSATVKALSILDTELIANVVGREVEEKNYKAICKQMGVDEYKDHGSMFSFKYKGTTGSIYRKDLSEEEKFQIIQRVKNSGLDEYEDRGWMFSFKYEGTTYRAEHKGFLLVEEENLRLIQDIKNSHELLISECYKLGGESATLKVYIDVDEHKDIEKMYFHNPDKNISEWLDKTLISRSKPEVDVDEIEQPSNFLSNIFSAIKSVIDSISSFFSWLFGSKEEEQFDNNLSLLNLSEEQSDDNLSLLKPDVNQDADENYVGNYSLCNHDYHQHDDLI
ncbi:hypothetical protein [Wolbachia endosymbiont (group A) of Andrena hattorfiana]|uniref:hypothetical protein n=1 Tax=Wolbachia endosymbiont (group A) of Andrena hattorfiana TaxID=2953977 RepID=UPI0021F81645|nr:hypothetical protein [Wolbachia endosymbiont (group A) of Andrena hattorfiana]